MSTAKTHSTAVRAGINQVQLDLSTLPAGVYMATSEVNGARSVVKVMKQ